MFFITSNVPFAAFIMVAIAVDRYLCICHPFRHLMNAQRAKRITLSLADAANGTFDVMKNMYNLQMMS
jgi:cholecystokinin A receptor/hypocretin (orexin) receptor 2